MLSLTSLPSRDRSEQAAETIFSQPARAPSREADIAKVQFQEWLGHANVSTTRGYNRHKMCSGEQPGCCTGGSWALI